MWQSHKVAARLHRRVVTYFCVIAAFPAILVGIVGSMSLERLLNPWFAGALKEVIEESVIMGEHYRILQCQTLLHDASLISRDIAHFPIAWRSNTEWVYAFLHKRAMLSGFQSLSLIDAAGRVHASVNQDGHKKDGLISSQGDSEDLRYEPQPGESCFISKDNTVLRTVLKVSTSPQLALFAVRQIPDRLQDFPALAKSSLEEYRHLDQKKTSVQQAFASAFVMIALIVILSALWFGLVFAAQLIRPIRRLIHAADRVTSGDLGIRVPVDVRDDDLAHLSSIFNKMIGELHQQHERLIAARDLIDERHQFTEAVLSGVSSGIISLNSQNRILSANPAAYRILGTKDLIGQSIDDVFPEGLPLLSRARDAFSLCVTLHNLEKEERPFSGPNTLKIIRNDEEATVSVSITSCRDDHLVMTLDDMTHLIHAQRTAAWADVARNIAHEIKNPLTPIQLSVERIQRRYGPHISGDRVVFDTCLDVISRHVDTITRLVDDFSAFARLPKPIFQDIDVCSLISKILCLMRTSYPHIVFEFSPEMPMHIISADPQLMTLALTNVVKNGIESITQKYAISSSEYRGRLSVDLSTDKSDLIALHIMDNGLGFPMKDRQKLLVPYVSLRKGGTGLGLAVVARIFSDFGGGVTLRDHPTQEGAWVHLWCPSQQDSGKFIFERGAA
jgi:two-component system nitrogen regulation sensor histidine kinase NtrY